MDSIPTLTSFGSYGSAIDVNAFDFTTRSAFPNLVTLACQLSAGKDDDHHSLGIAASKCRNLTYLSIFSDPLRRLTQITVMNLVHLTELDLSAVILPESMTKLFSNLIALNKLSLQLVKIESGLSLGHALSTTALRSLFIRQGSLESLRCILTILEEDRVQLLYFLFDMSMVPKVDFCESSSLLGRLIDLCAENSNPKSFHIRCGGVSYANETVRTAFS